MAQRQKFDGKGEDPGELRKGARRGSCQLETKNPGAPAEPVKESEGTAGVLTPAVMAMAACCSHTGVPEACHAALPLQAQVCGLQDAMDPVLHLHTEE